MYTTLKNTSSVSLTLTDPPCSVNVCTHSPVSAFHT